MTNKNDAGKTAAEHPVVRYVNQVRVRYNDTDRMSFVYHANYAMYFEVSRLEMLRARGLTYKKMEEEGELSLSDAFVKKQENPNLEVIVKVKNINMGNS